MEPGTRLKAFPVQLIELADGVLMVRGGDEVKIGGVGAMRTLHQLFEGFAGPGAEVGQILDGFPQPEREAVGRLIDRLVERRFLVPPEAGPPQDRPETPLDIFYWNIETTGPEAAQAMSGRRIVIVGLNHVSRRLCRSLQASGVDDYELIDYELLRNLSFFDEAGVLKPEAWPEPLRRPGGDESLLSELDPARIGCLAATSDFGGQYIFLDFNAYCVDNNIPFLPVVLHRGVGLIGPLVIPGETACYQCLRSREEANLDNPDLARASEYQAHAGQSLVAFHPAMASSLGDLAALELFKFFTRKLAWRVGELIEVDLLAPELTVRRVLKVPRCPVCGPLAKKAAVSPLKVAFMPENYADYLPDKERNRLDG